MHKNRKIFAALAVFIAAALWGCIGLMIKPLLAAGYTRPEMIFVRSLVTALCVFGVQLVKDRQAVKIRWQDGWIFVGMGIVSFVFFNICYLKTIETAGLAVAAVLLYTAPAFVMILSTIFFREKLTPGKLIAVVLALGGCVLVTGLIGNPSVVLSPLGILTGLGAGFGYALYTIFGKPALARYPFLTVTAWAFAFATIGSAFMVDFSHLMTVATSSMPMLMLLIACGVLTGVIPYMLYTYGLTVLEGSRASVIACIEPVVAALAGILCYGESLTLTGVVGMLLIVAACLLSAKAK